MADTFQLEIVTPDRLLVSEAVSEAQIPGSNGYLGILPGHAPLITELAVGEISYKSGAKSERIAVAWGFAEVLPDKVTVIADTAERAAEIDVARARESKKRAEERLQATATETDFQRAALALQRAENRLKTANPSGDMANLVP